MRRVTTGEAAGDRGPGPGRARGSRGAGAEAAEGRGEGSGQLEQTTMSAGPVSKRYEYLGPQERLTLILEALARGDSGEADRLSGSCPRKDYRMRDAAYGDRLDTDGRPLREVNMS